MALLIPLFIRGGEELFTPMGGKERRSYFMLQWLHCFYEDFFLPPPSPRTHMCAYTHTHIGTHTCMHARAPIHICRHFIKMLFIIRGLSMTVFSLCNWTLTKIRHQISGKNELQFFFSYLTFSFPLLTIGKHSQHKCSCLTAHFHAPTEHNYVSFHFVNQFIWYFIHLSTVFAENVDIMAAFKAELYSINLMHHPWLCENMQLILKTAKAAVCIKGLWNIPLAV